MGWKVNIITRAKEDRRHKYWEEIITLEKKFVLELAKLMEKYIANLSEQAKRCEGNMDSMNSEI